MKQTPTIEEWNELKDTDKAIFCNRLDEDTYLVNPPTIGKMIEFLGDDWWEKIIRDAIWYEELESLLSEIKNKDLCNKLWGAVKYKLNNKK